MKTYRVFQTIWWEGEADNEEDAKEKAIEQVVGEAWDQWEIEEIKEEK